MKLNEPIIGLNYLDEVPCNDPQAGPRYTCRLCHHTANLQEMVRHLIGRKHRQKYVELKRPDLVTWDKQSMVTQGGKIIRAKAEIIERQDGRGTPLLLVKKRMEGKGNISRVPTRQKQNGNRNISQSLTHRDVPPLLPELNRDEYSHRGRFPKGYSNPPSFLTEDPYMVNRVRQMYQQEDTVSHDHMGDGLRRADYREADMYRPEYMDADYRRECEGEYVEDPQRRAVPEPGGVPRYDSRVEMPHVQAQHVEYDPEDASSYRRPYPERGSLKEFFSEEERRGRVCSAEHQPSQPVYTEDDNNRWSLDREPGIHDSMNIAGRQGSSEPEAKRSSFPTPMESDQSRDHLCNVIRDYCHEMREPHQEEAVANPGPSRTGPPTSQRTVEVTRAMSDIPEPFRRFLKRAPNDDEEHCKRKRKSRFSDATAEEVKTTKEMFSDEYGPPNPRFGGRPRPVSANLKPEIYESHQDLYIESKSQHHTESCQRGRSESGGVFDMLKNIEIENAEEADFLKNKLCNLLQEFKSKRLEKAGQNSQGRAVISKDYDHLKLDWEPSPRHQYETILKEDSDLRRPEDLYFKEDCRGRGWKQHEQIPDKRLQEYDHPVRREPRHSNSNIDERHQEYDHPVRREPRHSNSNIDERHQEYNHPVCREPRHSNSNIDERHQEYNHPVRREPRHSNSNIDERHQEYDHPVCREPRHSNSNIDERHQEYNHPVRREPRHSNSNIDERHQEYDHPVCREPRHSNSNIDERHQEYDHPVRREPRHSNSNRSRYEEVFGRPDMSRTPHATHPDEPASYPERFQEPMHPRDYRPAAEAFFDSHCSSPPFHMERGPRMDRDLRYSNNLEKITSTLLELVARK
ncbi:uncharacterized protein si:ch211-13c6.2 isoform X2 [Micropterus salmoides]|nr:uncharacterized protein si:ch211-13c6.2 isoform X2 [Micropterus salmoides]XP_038580877.1 uncharacterized protein si:ch211-13c6.2 isoform X2 [Micropterus salmoides]XP_038580878.1 uncharacterized protein si:ch211-13c6.2 isoform X2 [Micropterus salmoides]